MRAGFVTSFESCAFVFSSRRRHTRSEEHTSSLQSLTNLVCRLLLEKKSRGGRRPENDEIPEFPETFCLETPTLPASRYLHRDNRTLINATRCTQDVIQFV